MQVSRILFEVLKLPPPPCARELKIGGYSTGQDVLLELHEHTIAQVIFEHRKLKALLGRYDMDPQPEREELPVVNQPHGSSFPMYTCISDGA